MLHPLINKVLGHNSGKLLCTALIVQDFSFMDCLLTHKHTHQQGHLVSLKQSAIMHIYLIMCWISCCKIRCSYNAFILALSTGLLYSFTQYIQPNFSVFLPLFVVYYIIWLISSYFSSGCKYYCNPHHGAEVSVTCASVQAPLWAGDGGKCLYLHLQSTLCQLEYCIL